MKLKTIRVLITLLLLSAGLQAQQVTVCRNALNKPILDFSTTIDTIVLSLPPNSRILDVNVRIDTVLHTYDSDLRFYLRHLDSSVSFIRNVGQGGDNFIFTNINDSASCAIGSQNCNLPPFSGIFRPTLPRTLLPFNYQAANGLWVLAISDTFAQDTGVLKAWCLQVAYDNNLSSENNNQQLPSEYVLGQNYPNPFNSKSKIKYQISKTGWVRLKVFNVLGNEVMTPVNKKQEQGIYEAEFDGMDLPSGVYFYRLQITNYKLQIEYEDVKKMVLIR